MEGCVLNFLKAEWKVSDTDWAYLYLYPFILMQSVPITTKVVNSNPIHGKVYSIQHYVIKFVSDLRQVGGFLWVTVKNNSGFLYQ
jgi:hypothetical protein